jgi:hypothetical protein
MAVQNKPALQGNNLPESYQYTNRQGDQAGTEQQMRRVLDRWQVHRIKQNQYRNRTY